MLCISYRKNQRKGEVVMNLNFNAARGVNQSGQIAPAKPKAEKSYFMALVERVQNVFRGFVAKIEKAFKKPTKLEITNNASYQLFFAEGSIDKAALRHFEVGSSS